MTTSEETQNTNAVGKVNSDIQDTISSANSISGLYKEIKGEVAGYHDWKQRVNNLLADLGEWAPMVFRKNSWWLPVLRTDQFESHLAANEGVLTPQSSRLRRIYRLGKSTQEEFDPTSPGAVRLQVDGPVLCHIINLYKIYSWRSNYLRVYFESLPLQFTLSFGRLDITDRGGSIVVVFGDGSQDELRQVKVPFQYEIPAHYEWRRKIAEQSSFTLYQLALQYGISNTRATLGIDGDHNKKSRKEWAQRLIESINLVLESTEELFLITEQWLRSATRIYRRVTVDPDTAAPAGDQADKRLAEFIAKSVSSSSTLAGVAKLYPHGYAACFVANVQKTAEHLCMVSDNSQFDFIWSSLGTSLTHLELETDTLITMLASAPLALKGAWDGQWNDDLAEMVEDGTLPKLFQLPNALIDDSVMLMNLTEHHELWSAKDCYVA